MRVTPNGLAGSLGGISAWGVSESDETLLDCCRVSGAQLAVVQLVLEQVAFQDPHSRRKVDAYAHSAGRVLIYPWRPFIADSSGQSWASQGFATQATSSTAASLATFRRAGPTGSARHGLARASARAIRVARKGAVAA